MTDLRKAPRVNVFWRGAIALNNKNIVPVKVSNISESGVQVVCASTANVSQEYQLMMEVPKLDITNERVQVVCKIVVLHSVLTNDGFRLGARFSELSPLHKELILAWVSKSR